MAIEKRKLPNGATVGFDTARNCYCELPKDYKDPASEAPGFGAMVLEDLTVPQLEAYAKAENIELGEATRKADIIEVIRRHQAPQV